MSDVIQTALSLANLSVVDHAFIDNRGLVIGGSYNPNFIVSGKTDPVEKVVVDFSTIKKDIKKIIDRHEHDVMTNGFDHKLWIIPGVSNCTYSVSEDGTRVDVFTPVMHISCPVDAVRVFHRENYAADGWTTDEINALFETECEADVQDRLREIHPKVDISVECINTTDVHTPYTDKLAVMFRYAHGLRDSTSYGCKNIAHGHLSYAHLFLDRTCEADLPQVSRWHDALQEILVQAIRKMHNHIFIRADNVVEKLDDGSPLAHNWIGLAYDTPRGRFNMQLDSHKVPHTILETETTIEFLVQYLMGHIYSIAPAILESFEVQRTEDDEPVDVVLVVSEGLSKGCQVTLSL